MEYSAAIKRIKNYFTYLHGISSRLYYKLKNSVQNVVYRMKSFLKR